MVVLSDQTPPRGAIALAQFELAVLQALSGLEVVGVGGVVGSVAVLGDPEGGAVGPHASGGVVAPVEFLDVAADVPLEVDVAGRGATTATAAAPPAAGSWTVIVTLMLAVPPCWSSAVTVTS